MSAIEIGLLGEWRAARYIKKAGLRILEKRYRTKHGEIDLVARDGDVTVMIEVKTRLKGQLGDGLRAVDYKKQQHLRYAAACYMQSHTVSALRFDVIEITASGIRHIKNAF